MSARKWIWTYINSTWLVERSHDDIHTALFYCVPGHGITSQNVAESLPVLYTCMTFPSDPT
ncbi:hypothetical protein M404DRAFT_996206 [Pisolithus tinctorius Marx 270]|uniref:Uncharacterized protein n=1 Tax=Pisolithus tinctorius Marx 270 TaxID=870435 RepID=A0A0C3PM47_PISTI|nr:hypothetical protein M404DRAFT_996206 [Pisolithus tinctorius Marx 270]